MGLSFVNKLKEMGYEEVKLIPTDNGRFMTRWEATWMALSESAILLGRNEGIRFGFYPFIFSFIRSCLGYFPIPPSSLRLRS